MGNMCSKPQPPEPKPAPKTGEPGPSAELVQLRSDIKNAKASLNTYQAKAPTLKKNLDDLIPALQANAEVISSSTTNVKPIDDEIQAKLSLDSEAESSVCVEKKPELLAINEDLKKYSEKTTVADKNSSAVAELSQSVNKLLVSINGLITRAATFQEELAQATELKTIAENLLAEVSPLEATATTQKTEAYNHDTEFQFLKQKIEQYLAHEEEVVEEVYQEVIQEQEVATEAPREYSIDDLFDPIAYSQWLLSQSSIMQTYAKLKKEEFGQTDLKTVLTVFERIAKEKVAADSVLIASGVRPLDFDQFLVNWLLGSDRETGGKSFCEFISGLLEAARGGQYPEVITRLLGIHSERSIAPSLSAFIPTIISEFDSKFKFLQVSKAVKSRIMEQSDLETVQELMQGGEIKLEYVIETLFEVLRDRSEIAIAWVKALKPVGVTYPNYLLFILYNRFKFTNSDSTRVFKELTSTRTIDFEQFSTGLKNLFNLELSLEDFRILFDIIDRTKSGSITRVTFSSELKLQWYFDLREKPEFTISKAQFLEGYLDIGLDYMKTIVWETYLSSKDFMSRPLEFRSAEFDALASAFEVTETSELLAKVQETGKCTGADTFGFDDLWRFGLNRPFGNLGKFAYCKCYAGNPVTLPHGKSVETVTSSQQEVNSV